jgi:hypothetical protein
MDKAVEQPKVSFVHLIVLVFVLFVLHYSFMAPSNESFDQSANKACSRNSINDAVGQYIFTDKKTSRPV